MYLVLIKVNSLVYTHVHKHEYTHGPHLFNRIAFNAHSFAFTDMIVNIHFVYIDFSYLNTSLQLSASKHI